MRVTDTMSASDGPVKVASSIPYTPYCCHAPPSSYSPTQLGQKGIVDILKMLRDKHIGLHSQILQENYEAEQAINSYLKKVERQADSLHHSPKTKAEILDPITIFYKDAKKAFKSEEAQGKGKFDSSRLERICAVTLAILEKITESKAFLEATIKHRECGLINKSEFEKTIKKQMETEIQMGLEQCKILVDRIETIAGSNYVKL